ncbi:MAG TPA: ABC-F family ATP-binding cassette domain-containing protein, partial [Planctomycetaceae bacterium]|nr:ABC-F family ATP-binding cassette domain-containing protein [Planctomycetaceae bacterium]
MFRFERATIRAGGKVLFSDLNWQVGHGEKIGLVGPNGSGKTTLLRVISGHHELDAGRIHVARSMVLGYLPQTGVKHAGRTVFHEARSVFDEVLRLKEAQSKLLLELESLPEDSPEIDQILEEVQQTEDRLHHLDGYRIDAQVAAVLSGLGFQRSSWDQLTETLSGGWQMRLALAKLLLRSPNLILLDEPTNHLDMAAREWLATYLNASRATIIVVAHDRHFLDQVVDKTTEIEAATLVDYAGGYSAYVKQKEKRLNAQLQAYKQQKKEIERIQAFVERFRYKATKAAQVQSRLNRLEKLERLSPPPPARRRVRVRFPPPPRSAAIVAELQKMSKAYGDITVLRDIDLTVHAGDKIALIGPNGSGKSTLMKLLAGKEYPDRGIRRLGEKVIPTYFAQDQAAILTGNNSVLDELLLAAPGLGEPQARTLLGAFLFSGADV